MAKTSLAVQNKKASRIAYEKLSSLVVPDNWMEEIELESLKSRNMKNEG